MRKWLVIFFLLIASTAYGFRVAKPPTLTLPLTKDQVNQLNDYLNKLWLLQQGEFNFDIVTTAKTGANEGDVWFIKTGAIVYIQYKANNRVFTVTPNGF